MINRDQRLAIFMEGALGEDIGKMGYGVMRYSSNPISCVIDSRHAGQTVGDAISLERDYIGAAALEIPVVGSVDEAMAMGSDTLVLGIAPLGGLIPEAWYSALDMAASRGLLIVNGLHDLLSPRYGKLAWDVRSEPTGLKTGTGSAAKLPCRRVLMIGTDMAVGKMTAGLEIQKAARARSTPCEFVATGQIGIVITGSGVPLDAVRVDFASGSIEREMLAAYERLPHSGEEMIIVEGQGALIHPGSSANLPLLRGSCPTHLVLCHKAGATHLRRYPEVAIPPLRSYVRLYEDLAEACGTFPRPKTVAVAVNSMLVGQAEGRRIAREIEAETGWTAVDPLADGADRLLDALLA